MNNFELNEALKSSKNVYCSGLSLSARWFAVSSIKDNRLKMIILPSREEAEYCANDMYGTVEGDRVFFLPDSAINFHKSNFKASSQVQRTSAIEQINIFDGKNSVYIISYPEAVEEAISATAKEGKILLQLKKGQEISHIKLSEILTEAGFERVDFVAYPGQFAIRGGIIDIFSYDFNNPYRISFFGDEIDRINIFNTNSQLSEQETDEIKILDNYSKNEEESGSEYTVLDILPEDTLICLSSPDILSERSFYKKTERYSRLFLQTPLQQKDKVKSIKFNIVPQPVFNKNFELLTEDIKKRYTDGYKVYIYSSKQSQIDRLKNIILENGGIVPEFIIDRTIHEGFIDNEDRICHYSDHEIFDRFHRPNLRRNVEKTEQLTANDLAAFNIGDYIVHIDLGIGIFGGLVRIKDDKGRFHEVVKLQYKDGDVVFISVHSLHKISKFKPKDTEAPKITKLGSKTWITLKSNTKKKVKDIARELIQIYAKRKASKGFAFSADGSLQQELESSFEWEDTPDQERATEAIKQDMEDISPMDRLVCGDVGFGKTELAIRAAFKAVCDGKQVAVLVPTTILCLQHFNTFTKRLAAFPCNVEYLSRLKSATEVKDIQTRLENGKIDIIIGTHKLLGDSFKFKDLGLLIIDEEQKFGVSSKEKLRRIKASVDTLTLTATPIPRTLQFSLLGARDLSIINTPPPNRVPVQTEIMLFNKDEIKSIINYELRRQGQIFFVHNRVEELENIKDILHRLVPEMSICVAHGQMEPKVLEDKIMQFMAGEWDMLLCTTIIENGLDIPNANTIIINQAQNFGLSDMHQLRGRVGRSKTKGFCYLIVPALASITDDARKRLQAIENFSDLGSGFNIAMQDLDIRGAGNMLGAEQSGFIADMGMETYQKILAEAMEELGVDNYEESGPLNETFVSECAVETDIAAYIPDEYVDMTAEKIRIYKELDSSTDDKVLMKVKANLEDRFGNIPAEVDALFDVIRIRTLGRRIGFEKVIVKNGLLICFFVSNPMSSYYRSKRFGKVIERINENTGIFEMKQKESSLRVVCRNIDSLQKAYSVMSILND